MVLNSWEKAKEANPDTPIIMISGHGTIETAVEAVKKGAYDYISKPPDLNRLLITIRNAMDKTSLVAEAKVLKAPGEQGPGNGGLFPHRSRRSRRRSKR